MLRHEPAGNVLGFGIFLDLAFTFIYVVIVCVCVREGGWGRECTYVCVFVYYRTNLGSQFALPCESRIKLESPGLAEDAFTSRAVSSP